MGQRASERGGEPGGQASRGGEGGEEERSLPRLAGRHRQGGGEAVGRHQHPADPGVDREEPGGAVAGEDPEGRREAEAHRARGEDRPRAHPLEGAVPERRGERAHRGHAAAERGHAREARLRRPGEVQRVEGQGQPDRGAPRGLERQGAARDPVAQGRQRLLHRRRLPRAIARGIALERQKRRGGESGDGGDERERDQDARGGAGVERDPSADRSGHAAHGAEEVAAREVAPAERARDEIVHPGAPGRVGHDAENRGDGRAAEQNRLVHCPGPAEEGQDGEREDDLPRYGHRRQRHAARSRAAGEHRRGQLEQLGGKRQGPYQAQEQGGEPQVEGPRRQHAAGSARAHHLGQHALEEGDAKRAAQQCLGYRHAATLVPSARWHARRPECRPLRPRRAPACFLPAAGGSQAVLVHCPERHQRALPVVCRRGQIQGEQGGVGEGEDRDRPEPAGEEQQEDHEGIDRQPRQRPRLEVVQRGRRQSSERRPSGPVARRAPV